LQSLGNYIERGTTRSVSCLQQPQSARGGESAQESTANGTDGSLVGAGKATPVAKYPRRAYEEHIKS